LPEALADADALVPPLWHVATASVLRGPERRADVALLPA
jgi:hypothetical protein